MIEKFDEDWRQVRSFLDTIEDPFVLFPIEEVAKSLSGNVEASWESFNEYSGLYGFSRKSWTVPMELAHEEIGVSIGSAFVLGQVAITQTITLFLQLRDFCPNPDAFPKSKEAILNFESEIDSKSGLSEITIIDVAANYFKHHYEWPFNWNESTCSKTQSKTIKNAKLIGMSPGEITGNVYCALSRLKINSDNIVEISRKIQNWREKLARKFYLALNLPDPNDHTFITENQ